jgi:hypothetical protein
LSEYVLLFGRVSHSSTVCDPDDLAVLPFFCHFSPVNCAHITPIYILRWRRRTRFTIASVF